MKRLAYLELIVAALFATACLQDNPSPVNDPDIPQVSVDSETLTRISATLNGSLGKAGGIVAYGFEMTSTNFDDNPDRIVEVTTLDGEGRFSHTAEVKPGAYYAVRSFISDGHNKKYSKELSLTVPTTSVATVSEVTIQGDKLYADVVDDGGRTIREVGFCWSESSDNQTIRLTRMKGEWHDGDTFTARLPEMAAGHTYYFLAYAENAADSREDFGYSRTPASYLMTDEQFVDIEDPVFFRYLVGRFDKNQDGKLTAKELEVATDITVNTDQIASIQGIEWMPLLASLDCRGSAPGKGGLHAVDLSRNPLLTTFYCANNQFSELDLSSCFRLTDLDCSGNAIDTLDVTRLPYLRKLLFRGNPLETVDVSYCTELQQLDGTDCPQLRWVFVSLEQYGAFPSAGTCRIDAAAQYYPVFVPIQDDYLYQSLMSVYDLDGDNRISAAEAAYVTRIDVCAERVTTMAGIEFFYNLEELICASCMGGQIPGQLTDLDLSRNPKLKYLDCHGNSLTQLDLSNNRALETLICADNMLTSLDVTGLSKLKYLNCGYNRLSRLDVTHNYLLTELHFPGNAIASVDLSGCPVLSVLECSQNQIRILDITQNVLLTTVWCENNRLIYLNVSNNSMLTDVRTDNVYIPDSEFKSYLVAAFDGDGDAEISLAEAWKITQISVETSNISSLEGIQSFLNLERLECGVSNPDDQQGGGQLTELDLSQNAKLKYLDCRYNGITSLNFTHNQLLERLICVGNEISELNLTYLSALAYLDCAQNPIETLDLSRNPELYFLHCQYMELSQLDVSNNPKLRSIYCSDNALTQINLADKPALTVLECRYNRLSSLDVSGCPALQTLDCRGNRPFSELRLKQGQVIETLLLDYDDIDYIYL